MRNKYTWTTILSVLFVTIALFLGNLSAFALDIPSPPKKWVYFGSNTDLD